MAISRVLVAGLAAALTLVPGATARSTAGACAEDRAGGEWSTYGQDLLGDQRQDAEDIIDPTNVAALTKVWSAAEASAQSPPPIVSGGCVFLNAGGRIVAYDIDTCTQVGIAGRRHLGHVHSDRREGSGARRPEQRWLAPGSRLRLPPAPLARVA